MAADEVLRKLEEQLTCSICCDTYREPKILQCFHVFCQQCLVRLVENDLQGLLGAIILCPICRQLTPIPDGTVARLQSAFLINRLFEIHTSLNTLQEPPIRRLPCTVHGEEELQLFCETCAQLICHKCGLKGGNHHLHDYCELRRAVDKYSGEVASKQEEMEKQVQIIERSLEQLKIRDNEICDQKKKTTDAIKDALKEREKKLNNIDKLEQMTEAKRKGLAAQRDQLETTLVRLKSCIHLIRDINTSNAEDVLKTKTNTIDQVKELATPLKSHILEPNTEADIIFSPAVCQSYGELSSPGKPDPSNFRIKGKGGVVGKESTVILRTFNF